MNHLNTESEKSLEAYLLELGSNAKVAAKKIASAQGAQKNAALLAISESLLDSQQALIEANAADLEKAQDKGFDSALIDRLRLDEKVITSMAVGCQQVADLPDPVGEISELSYRPSGIQVGKMRVPLGVIGIIYESRPNVTVDAAILCLKSGNATILRGGSEAFCSNQAIAACIADGLTAADLDAATVNLLKTTDRAAVGHLITMAEHIDMIIPRGGKGLIERISREASVPVLKHLDGICHVYVDCDADLAKAHRIAINSKTHRYGVCNAMETLLVHRDIAAKLLPSLFAELTDLGVELRVCEKTRLLMPAEDSLIAATAEDWDTEYLAPILSVRVVDGLAQAIEHIAQHSSDHTESIVTENISSARRFLAEVDSSSVMVNASTRFADGFEYGLGAEIGISTNKLHARGPVGLQGLTTQKYVVYGNGQIRE